MSKNGQRGGANNGGRGGSRDERAGITPRARRTQIIIGIVMGLIVGAVLGWLTDFWWWLPAGVAFGLATGAIMKPPAR